MAGVTTSLSTAMTSYIIERRVSGSIAHGNVGAGEMVGGTVGDVLGTSDGDAVGEPDGVALGAGPAIGDFVGVPVGAVDVGVSTLALLLLEEDVPLLLLPFEDLLELLFEDLEEDPFDAFVEPFECLLPLVL